MASIKKMNLTIAEWLYGEGKVALIDHWKTKNNRLVGRINFHENYDALMKAMKKAMGEGKEFKNSDQSKQYFWYAIYANDKIINKQEPTNKWIRKVCTYSCAFTLNGRGRMDYGKKFNQNFEKATPILAMHYSLYRLIKNGLEY